MTIYITETDTDSDTHLRYNVAFFDDNINTLVTQTPSMARSWIQKMKYIHRFRLRNLIVGLDVEWRPNSRNFSNPVATLQLCIGHHCLIFQLIYAPTIPKCLFDFLGDQDYTFVGIGIEDDVVKLRNDYGLEVANFVDLRDLEARRNGWMKRRQRGLKTMAAAVLGKDFEKPKNISRSHWDNPWLSPAQVSYACVDAFVSFEIGRVLRAAD